MAFTIVLWTEEDLYSVANASQVHYAGEIFEDLDAMVDYEGKKGRKTGREKLPTQGKLLRLEVGGFSTVLRPLLK